MESKDELKEVDIKNCTCYYFDDIMRVRDRDIDFSDILLDEILYNKRYENILIYDISYKTSTGEKPLRIRFDKIDGFIKIHDGIKYLLLFDPSWYDDIYDRIKYLISDKVVLQIVLIIILQESEIDSYNSLPIEKILTFHNVIMLIKSVINKNKNNCYYNIFLEKGLHKDKSNTEYF